MTPELDRLHPPAGDFMDEGESADSSVINDVAAYDRVFKPRRPVVSRSPNRQQMSPPAPLQLAEKALFNRPSTFSTPIISSDEDVPFRPPPTGPPMQKNICKFYAFSLFHGEKLPLYTGLTFESLLITLN